MNKKQKKVFYRILAATFFTGVFSFLRLEEHIMFFLFLLPYIIIGYDVVKKAVKGIGNKQIFDENFLMTIATLGAMGLGDYKEAVAVMLFYQIGELFQSYAVGKSRRSISALMDIRPDYANLLVDGKFTKVDPDEVTVGNMIQVVPGEKVPLDGIVTEGTATINTSALTGESIPKQVRAGDEILSGCINENGVLLIQTTKDFYESTATKILEMVENASSKKSKPENFISKFAKFYTPIVCGLALLLALIPPIVCMFLSISPEWSVWFYRALTFLVISCPCALVISIPLSFFACIGGASRAGILIKGSNYIETLAKASRIVFDKTGTLTEGVFEVTAIHHNKVEEKQILAYAAMAESFSNHPISKSLKKAYGKEIDTKRVTCVTEMSGNGIKACIDGKQVAVGNDKLMQKLGIPFVPCHSVGTIVHVALEQEYMGHIVINDRVKPHSEATVLQLKKMGIEKIVMLTGDGQKTAEDVANRLHITEYHSELLPVDKLEKVEKYLELNSEKKNSVVFVGDGINDAPVLTRADVGVAMGALGSDAAIEAADIVLMDDDPMKLLQAIKLSKKCIRIVYENIYFALGIKVICLLLGAVGIANMWAAIFSDVGVMVLAILNAIRVMKKE